MSMKGGSYVEMLADSKPCKQCKALALPKDALNDYCDECEALRSITRLSARVRELEPALAFLKSVPTEGCIVSSAACSELEIATARACGRFYVEPGGGQGWLVRPSRGWSLRESLPSEPSVRETNEAGGTK